MQLEAVKDQLNQALASLSAQEEKVKKALQALEESVDVPPNGKRHLSPAAREKIRQAALKRWAGKKKAPPAKSK